MRFPITAWQLQHRGLERGAFAEPCLARTWTLQSALWDAHFLMYVVPGGPCTLLEMRAIHTPQLSFSTEAPFDSIRLGSKSPRHSALTKGFLFAACGQHIEFASDVSFDSG